MRPPSPPEAELTPRGRFHSRERDARAVRHHYDVPTEFFRLFLGPSMTYSCAIFSRGARTLEEAQEAKHELICQKLGLERGQRVLDVGSGWGAFAIHAAKRHGVQVTGITVSPPQVERARWFAEEAGVADRVDFRLADYRDLAGESYDAVASIGMVEHVGAEQMDEYGRRLRGALRPGGTLLLHGIANLQQEDPQPGPFSARYVFPDGAPQPLSRMLLGLERAGFETHHIEGFRDDYAETLRHWARRARRQRRRGHPARGSRARARLAAVPAGGPQRLRDRLHLGLPGARVVIGEAVVRVHRGSAVESEHRVAWAVSGGERTSVRRCSSVRPPSRSRRSPGCAAGWPSASASAPTTSRSPAPRTAAARATSCGCARCCARPTPPSRTSSAVRPTRATPSPPRIYRDAGGQPERVRHNCSGKHAFAIALARAEGWPVAGYVAADHPVQQTMWVGLAEATGLEPADLPHAIDGCGMQTFSVPLARLADAFGRLASGGLGPAGDQLAAAMTSHPELVAFDGALDTELMRAHPGLVAKIGAEGVLGIGLPDGRGAALKVIDGAMRGLDTTALLVLEERLGVTLGGPLREAAVVVNSRGEQVGRAEATFATPA